MLPASGSWRPQEAATRGGTPRAAAPGLVSYTTSQTDPSEIFHVDVWEARVKRMRQSVLTSARLIQEGLQHSGHRFKAAMLTVTYASVNAWRPDHISNLTNHMRMYLTRRGHRLCGVWVAELQQRGAVHYHFVVWLPKGITFPKPDKQGWWPHGMTQWQWARRAVGYLVKYTSKVVSKHRFPKGCRISAACGLNSAQRMERRWWRMPQCVRSKWPDWHDDVRRCPGGGFLSRQNGEYMPPLFRFIESSGGWVTLQRLNAPDWTRGIKPSDS